MDNRDSEGRQPSRKLGVKYLDRFQMENTFPDYQALMQRIESQRTMLMSAQGRKAEPWNWSSPPMYDNVYAVLGGRGAGKSSALLTLRHYLSMNEVTDILYPIITPEIIGDRHCSILGWIMAITEQIVDDVENRIRSEARRQGIGFTGNGISSLDSRCGTDFFKDCVFQRQNLLRRSYEELCEASQGGWEVGGLAYEDAIDMRTQNSRRQYRLRQKLNEFWKLLTDVWFEVNQIKDAQTREAVPYEQKKRPMIVMMFDDIDLVPERSMELLTTTFQFLSNVNIVLILSAAERVLKQVIYMKMHERMIGSNYRSLLQEFYSNREKLSRQEETAVPGQMDTPEKMMTEFYNKVIPPANRYQLRRYNTILERSRYSYSCIDQSFTAPAEYTVSTKLEDFLLEQVGRIYAEVGKPQNENFLLNTSDSKQQFRRAYLVMFGNKNRNIANGCLEIMNAVTRLCTIYQEKTHGKPNAWEITDKESKDIEAVMRHLLRALVLSKDEVSQYSDDVDQLIHCSRNNLSVYVDYTVVMALYNTERAEIRERYKAEAQRHKELSDAKQRIGALMVMLFFIENLLLLFDKFRYKVHGYRELTELLNADLILEEDQRRQEVPLKLFRTYRSVEDFLDESVLVFEHIDRYTGFSVFDLQYVQDYLQNLTGIQADAPELFLAERIDIDREWVRTVLMMLFVRNSGITLADSTFLLDKTAASSCRLLDMFEFGGKFNRQIRRAAPSFFQKFRLAEESTRLLGKFDRICKSNLGFFEGKKDLKALLEGTRLDELRPHSTAKREQYYARALEKNSGFMENYIAIRWEIEQKGNVNLNFNLKGDRLDIERCYRLITFVENVMKDVAESLKKAGVWELRIPKSQVRGLSSALTRLDDFDIALKREKDTILARLDKFLMDEKDGRSTKRYVRYREINAVEPGGQKTRRIESDPKETDDPICSISADGLLKYLVGVYSVLYESDMQERIPLYLQVDNGQAFFEILQYLRFYEKDFSALYLGVTPLTSHIVLEVKMLEFLQFYYLAAKFGIALNSRYRSERSFLEAGSENGHRDMTETDRRLKKLYQKLSSPQKGSESKNMIKLRELMRSVRKETAMQYYQMLEERE